MAKGTSKAGKVNNKANKETPSFNQPESLILNFNDTVKNGTGREIRESLRNLIDKVEPGGSFTMATADDGHGKILGEKPSMYVKDREGNIREKNGIRKFTQRDFISTKSLQSANNAFLLGEYANSKDFAEQFSKIKGIRYV